MFAELPDAAHVCQPRAVHRRTVLVRLSQLVELGRGHFDADSRQSDGSKIRGEISAHLAAQTLVRAADTGRQCVRYSGYPDRPRHDRHPGQRQKSLDA